MTIISWDWKAQPNWSAVKKALKQEPDAEIIEVETGADEYAIVVAPAGTTQQEAQEFYHNH
jgi:hypothetical protein